MDHGATTRIRWNRGGRRTALRSARRPRPRRDPVRRSRLAVGRTRAGTARRRPPREDRLGASRVALAWERIELHAEQGRPFDLVHDHSGFTALAMADRVRVPVLAAKAMEGAWDLEAGAEEPSGVLGVERADGRLGNSGEPSRPCRLRGEGSDAPPITGEPGKGSRRPSGSRSGS